MSGKLKSVKRRGNNKRLAVRKPLVFFYCFLLLMACVMNKYMQVPVYASEGGTTTTIDYYTPEQVGQIKIGDMVVSLQNASGFTITDQNYINAIKNNMNGTDQDIAHVMEMSEADAVQYLNVCINNAESAGATKLQNSLSISSEMADYLNTQENYNIVPQNGGELLYESIKQTYNNNQNSDSDKATFWAALKNNYGSHGPGNIAMSRGLAKLTITGLAGTMFGVPGAVIAGLSTGIFGINVKNGLPITTKQSVINNMPTETSSIQTYTYEYQVNKIATQIYYCPTGFYPCVFRNGSEVTLIWCGSKSYNGQLPYKYSDSNKIEYRTLSSSSVCKYYSLDDVNVEISYSITGFLYDISNYGSNSLAAMNNFFNAITNNEVEKNVPKSPDVISNQGNLSYDDDNQSININQVYDPSDNYFLPIKIGSDSYGDYINNLNQNTTNNNYGQNGDVYNNYITNNYITNAPAIPTPTPTPVVPDQPVVPDIPSIENITPEEAQELIDNMLPDLRNFFPFCIPFDVLAIAQAFSSDNREAPVFDWILPLGIYGEQHIHLDLSQWDDIAALLRALELALFILGLMQFARAVDTKD